MTTVLFSSYDGWSYRSDGLLVFEGDFANKDEHYYHWKVVGDQVWIRHAKDTGEISWYPDEVNAQEDYQRWVASLSRMIVT